MMIDHWPRIRAQEQLAAENAAIEELEKRAAPLFWAMCLIVFAIALGVAVDGCKAVAAYHAGLIERIAEQAEQDEVLVQCIKGRTIDLDGALMRCEVTKYELVPGLRSLPQSSGYASNIPGAQS